MIILEFSFPQYSMEKLTHVMEWRAEEEAPDMIDLIALANGPETAPAAVEDPVPETLVANGTQLREVAPGRLTPVAY